MLVLARTVERSTIVIDDRIKVTLLSIRGNKVRLGIVAPADCLIHREEIWVKLRREAGKPTEIPCLLKKAMAAQSSED